MKNFDIKQSMYNWLIAIVLAIVVAGVTLSICLVPSFLPIANADVSSIAIDTWYIFDSSASSLPSPTSQDVSDYNASISVYWNDGVETYNFTSSHIRLYVNTGLQSNYSFYIYDVNDSGYLRLWYKTSTLELLHFYKVDMNGETGTTEITGGWCKINFASLVSNNNTVITNILKYCVSITTSPVPDVDDSPLLASEPIAFDIDFWYNQVDGYPLANLTHYSQRVCAFEILNAYTYESTYDSYLGVEIYVEVFYQKGADSLSTNYRKVLRPDNFGNYYLALYPFQSEPLPSTYFISGFRVSFYGYDDYIQIDSLHNQYVWLNFVQSYWSTIDNGIGEVGFDRGYNSGYNAGSTDNNNLYSLAWATLNFPFRIMFGTYDNNAYLENGDPNPNYHQYVGGLFNFSILGVDFRAFILGISSMCVVIAIIKLVLGTRGSSNG